MLFQHFDWDLTHQVLFVYNLPRAIIWTWETSLKMHILWCQTDICSRKISAKVFLMLDNEFPVLSLCKLNHISVCFIQISTKIACKQPKGKPCCFWSDPRCFGPLGKFQHNIEISVKTARVSRLSFRFLWLPWWRFTQLRKIFTTKANNETIIGCIKTIKVFHLDLGQVSV